MILRPGRLSLLNAALFAVLSRGCHGSSVARPNLVADRISQADPISQNEAPRAVASTASSSEPLAGSGAGAGSAVGVGPDADAAMPSATTASADVEETLPIVDADGKVLDQTDERPSVRSASFQKRLALLAEAIISGETEPAKRAFFPLAAYQKVKDVGRPERDYKFRLLANFKRDLLEYHRALGPSATEAKFQGVTVPESAARWMKPGAEGNKVGYFRVLRSSLHFVLPTGRVRDLELTSLISWRGEWYVVHLHGFK